MTMNRSKHKYQTTSTKHIVECTDCKKTLRTAADIINDESECPKGPYKQ